MVSNVWLAALGHWIDIAGADERKGLLEIVSGSDTERDVVADASVLVVNSGQGVFGDDELPLLKKQRKVD